MRCVSCGEKIEGDPVWKGDEAYCSQECAEIGSPDDLEDEEEECDEDNDEEEDKEV